jgi:steroid delta-isomerase-like uncharacterized protein
MNADTLIHVSFAALSPRRGGRLVQVPGEAAPTLEEVEMATHATVSDAPTPGERFAHDFADRWQKAWNSRVPEQVTSLCSEDVVWDDPLTERPERGRQAVADYLRSVWHAFPDLEFSWPEGPYAAFDGIKLALHWHVSGTLLGPLEPPGFAPTGKRAELDGVDLLELRDGLVCAYNGFFDVRGVAQQIGVLPARGSRGERMAVRLQRLQAGLSRRQRSR